MRFQAQAVEKYGIIMEGGVFVGILVVFVGFHIPISSGCYRNMLLASSPKPKLLLFMVPVFET